MSNKTFDDVRMNVQLKDYSGCTPEGSGSAHLDNLVSGENITHQLGKVKRWIEILQGSDGAMVYDKRGATITADSTTTSTCAITVQEATINEGYTVRVTSIAASPAYTGDIAVGDLLIALKDNPKVTADWVVDTDWAVLHMGGYPKLTYVTGDVYEHVAGVTAPEFLVDTYYSRSGSVYTLLLTEPDDWSTDWTKYYEKSTGRSIAIDYGN